ncbi:hypothetical protein PM082_001596 [Marasmius tenuissimus]|nr:hypothetical protein PM082_001596 [Marasmius tenuissimus]
MDILISTASSFVLRYVISNVLHPSSYSPSMIVPVFLGVWEGTWLHMLLLSMPSSYDPYLAYLLRPLVDFFISDGSVSYVFSVVLWSVLTMLALDAMGPKHRHDTRRERSSKRISSRTGSSHTAHTVLQPTSSSQKPRPISRRSRSRSLTFVLPVSSPESLNQTTSPPSQEQSQVSGSLSSTTTTLTGSSSSSSTTPQYISTASTPTPTRTEMTPYYQPIPPIQSPPQLPAFSPRADMGNQPQAGPVPASSPMSSIPLLQPPVSSRVAREPVVPAVAESSRSAYSRPPYAPSNPSYDASPSPTLVVSNPPTIPTPPEDRTPPAQAERDLSSPIPVPAPGFFPAKIAEPAPPVPAVAASNPAPPLQSIPEHRDETDTIRSPVLRGFDDEVGVESDVEYDELTTPPHLRARSAPSFITALEGAFVEEPPAVGRSLLLDSRTSRATIPSTSNVTANASPVPIPVPGNHISPALSALDILSPVSSSSLADSIISTTDPKQLFERAEKLRNKAWKEIHEKSKLKADLHKARIEGRKKDIFILAGDVKESEHRIDTLHARAKRRYYLAKNTEEMLNGDEIDVHGLLVEEAVDATEAAFRKILKDGKDSLRVIVGKGNHSKDATPKLKPAVTAAMKNHGFQCNPDPRNAGVLLLSL